MKYFPLSDGYVQTQFSTEMTEEAYNNLTNTTSDARIEAQKKRVGRTMILCLDKSGSMSGTPYDALKQGALLVAKSVCESNEFEHFAIVFYDNNADVV